MLEINLSEIMVDAVIDRILKKQGADISEEERAALRKVVIDKLGLSEDDKIDFSNRGKSLFELLDSYVCVDLETTGLDPQYDDIIEIGAVKVIDNQIVDTFETLVNPGYEIDGFITELTGITNAMLADAPDAKTALAKFDEFAGDAKLIGHNINAFDSKFLYVNYISELDKPLTNDFFDTLRLARRLYPEERHNRLSDLIVRFNISDAEAHRALSDAMHTIGCYNYMRKYMADNNISIESIKLHKKDGVRAKDITAATDEFDEDSPIFGKNFVITGALQKFTRQEAMQAIADKGGNNGDGVTKKTDYLVLGNNDYCATIKDGKSSKQKKAEALKLKGQDIEIISENVFYEMLNQ